MKLQLIRCNHFHLSPINSPPQPLPPTLLFSSFSSGFSGDYLNYESKENPQLNSISLERNRRRIKINRSSVVVSSSSTANPLWETLKSEKASSSSSTAPGPPLSDIIWPSAGAFAAMAVLGKMDQMLVSKGISTMTIAPLGAVCAVLFVTPSAPAAKKYNMFMAQIGCAAFGVLALTILGPGWLARSVSLAASIAFMVYTGTMHPPAASLPLLFIDAAKLHHLHLWYALFPGATGCLLLCLIQEVVCYLKDNFKF